MKDDLEAQKLYVAEIRRQCVYAMAAAETVDLSMRYLRDHGSDSEVSRIAPREVFRNLHSFLTHTSNVSKLFWPDERSSRAADGAKRGEVLRELFHVSDGVLRDRSLRNHLDHFDERLDRWRATSKHRNLADENIGPLRALGDFEATDVLRLYDPDGVFYFRGEAFNLRQMAAEVSRIEALCDCADEELAKQAVPPV